MMQKAAMIVMVCLIAALVGYLVKNEQYTQHLEDEIMLYATESELMRAARPISMDP